MASTNYGAALRQMDRLFVEGTVAGLSDAQLLERFLARRDESAFGALVERHGPLVLAICRARARDRADAEDAFQATFLLLARKGNSLRDRAALGVWLHRVARRVASQANADAGRRRRQETRAGLLKAERMAGSPSFPHDLAARLREEIDLLPDRYRLPLVVCHLEGLSHAEAARRLRWSERTLRRRLAEAREVLRSRLSGRGVAPPTVIDLVVPACEAPAPAPVPVPAVLVAATVAGMSAGRAAESSKAAVLAARVATSLSLARWTLTTASVLVAGAIAYLASGLASGVAARDAELPPRAAQPAPAAQRAAKSEESTIAFAGRVLDPDGEPFAGAALYLIDPPLGAGEGESRPKATSGPDGRFRFAIPRAEIEDADEDEGWDGVQVLATADGFGPDWHAAPRDGADGLSLRLVKDVPLTGRVFDLEGRPVAGARVVVRGVATAKGDDLSAYVATVADGTEDGNGRLLARRWSGRFPGQPEAVVTDADGRYRMGCFGGERLVEMGVEGPSIESLTLLAMTRVAKDVGGPGEKSLGSGSGRLHGAAFDLLVRPGRVITGIVRDKTTRRPIPGIRVGMLGIAAHSVTAEDGRFTVSGFGKAGEYQLFASSQQGQPYFVTCVLVPDVAGLTPIEADIDCVRGIPFRLRLVDEETGKPVAASVNYQLLHPNPASRDVPGYDPIGGFGAIGFAHRDADGTYVGAVLPGPGAITVRARGARYLPACVDPRAFFKVGPETPEGGFEGYGNRDTLVVASGRSQSAMPQSQYCAIVLTNPAADSGPLSFDVTLARDHERRVTVLDPDGRPLTGAVVTGADWKQTQSGPIEAATFTVTGLNPARVRRLTIRHDGRRLAGSLLLRGDEAEPSTVRLQPWATLSGRLVDAQGRPRAKVEMMDTDWADAKDDPARGWLTSRITTDRDGRFRIEALVPGQKYSASLINVKDGGEYGSVLRDVALKPGETLDLGDVRPTAKPDGDTP